MNRFSSKMSEDLENMIALKVATHHSESTYIERAKAFDGFCMGKYPDAELIVKEIVLDWVKDALDSHTRNVAHSRIAFARTFAQYQKAIEKEPYIPPKNMLNGNTLFIPYIMTDEELKMLFDKVDTNTSGTKFERVLLSIYFRLTYTCGLRPNESRMIKRADVDLNSGEIRIVNSKWNRSRTVIMSDDMCKAAKKYANYRDLKFPDCEYFFPTHDGGTYTAARMLSKLKKFYELSRPDIPKELLPTVRVYDFRFATAVLNNWIDEKIDINTRLPYLQTYMGHKNISATAYYIHLLPENLVKSSGIDWEKLNAVIPEVEPWEE